MPQEAKRRRDGPSLHPMPLRGQKHCHAQPALVYSQRGRIEKQKQGLACFQPAFPAWESARFPRGSPLTLSVPLKFLATSCKWPPTPRGLSSSACEACGACGRDTGGRGQAGLMATVTKRKNEEEEGTPPAAAEGWGHVERKEDPSILQGSGSQPS